MQRIRKWAERLRPRVFPDLTAKQAGQDRPLLPRLATPYTFNPTLTPRKALVAIAASLARIFGACLLFAVSGGVSAFAWNAIGNHFLRVAAVLALGLLFLGGFATLMVVIHRVEGMIAPRR